MLTADTATEVLANATTLLYCHLDELANTLLVENLEWVNLENLLVEIYWQEAGDVVARVTEGHLCEVVGTE